MTEEDQIVLQPTLDISAVQALHAKFMHALALGSAIRVDAGSVERVDTAALQLLYAFIKTASARGLVCTWTGVSAAFGAAVALCGMREVMRLAD